MNFVTNRFLCRWRDDAKIMSYVGLYEDLEVYDGHLSGFYVSMRVEVSSYVY